MGCPCLRFCRENTGADPFHLPEHTTFKALSRAVRHAVGVQYGICFVPNRIGFIFGVSDIEPHPGKVGEVVQRVAECGSIPVYDPDRPFPGKDEIARRQIILADGHALGASRKRTKMIVQLLYDESRSAALLFRKPSQVGRNRTLQIAEDFPVPIICAVKSRHALRPDFFQKNEHTVHRIRICTHRPVHAVSPARDALCNPPAGQQNFLFHIVFSSPKISEIL